MLPDSTATRRTKTSAARPMCIGVGQRGALGRIGNPQVLEFPFAAGQSTAYLSETECAAELAKEHGDELAPAPKSFCRVARTVLFHRLLKFNAREEL